MGDAFRGASASHCLFPSFFLFPEVGPWKGRQRQYSNMTYISDPIRNLCESRQAKPWHLLFVWHPVPCLKSTSLFHLPDNDLVVGIGPGFQMRNLGSERLSSSPEVTQPINVTARKQTQVFFTSKPRFVLLRQGISQTHRTFELGEVWDVIQINPLNHAIIPSPSFSISCKYKCAWNQKLTLRKK